VPAHDNLVDLSANMSTYTSSALHSTDEYSVSANDDRVDLSANMSTYYRLLDT
jgi:hypothetical protein